LLFELIGFIINYNIKIKMEFLREIFKNINSEKFLNLAILILLLIFVFNLGFIFGAKIFKQSPIIINCPEYGNN
jgi:hypothetical protein